MINATTTSTSVKGNWNEQKGKLKAKFSTLTDADATYAEGKKDEMLSKIQVELGKMPNDVFTLIKNKCDQITHAGAKKH